MKGGEIVCYNVDEKLRERMYEGSSLSHIVCCPPPP